VIDLTDKKRCFLAPLSLEKVVIELREFLLPVLAAISTDADFDMVWRTGDRWH
jgi:hypothetical protein